MSRPVKAFVVVYDTAELLPHFLRHSDRLGVSEFVIGLSLRSGESLSDVVREHAKHYHAHVYWRTLRASGIPDKEKIEEMLRTRHPTALEDYAMWLDLDEFHSNRCLRSVSSTQRFACFRNGSAGATVGRSCSFAAALP